MAEIGRASLDLVPPEQQRMHSECDTDNESEQEDGAAGKAATTGEVTKASTTADENEGTSSAQRSLKMPYVRGNASQTATADSAREGPPPAQDSPAPQPIALTVAKNKKAIRKQERQKQKRGRGVLGTEGMARKSMDVLVQPERPSMESVDESFAAHGRSSFSLLFWRKPGGRSKTDSLAGTSSLSFTAPVNSYQTSLEDELEEYAADNQCSFITNKQWLQVLRWLPIRFRLCDPKVVFRATEHGYNLATLRHKCEDLSPLVIIIKTLSDPAKV